MINIVKKNDINSKLESSSNNNINWKKIKHYRRDKLGQEKVSY